MARPNILFLFSDQHNARVMGCAGHPDVKTPRLDALAASGTMFDHACAQSPICTPSRMCFLSGQYCLNHGYYGLMGPMPAALPSLFSVARAQGYRTGAFGKIHTPRRWLGQEADVMADFAGRELARGEAEGENPYEAHLAARGLLGERDDHGIPEWLARHGKQAGSGLDARPTRLGFADTADGWAAGQAADFVRASAGRDEPFCAWVSLPRPHATYLPAQEFWDLYDERSFTLPPNADDPMTGRSPAARQVQAAFRRTTEWALDGSADWELVRRRVLRGYYGCVSQVDAGLGLVLDALEASGQRENTLVVYASDHGDFAGEHGMIEKAPGIGFGCITHIPFIWSWPGHLPAGARRSSLVESVDFLPTVCALTGLSAPEAVDGRDLSPVLADDTAVREVAVTEHPWSKTIRDARHKLTLFPPEVHGGQAHGELFDLIDDPWELNNLYDDPAQAAAREKLTLALVHWLATKRRPVTANPMPPPDPQQPGRRGWDEAPELYASDGRLRPGVIEQLLELGRNRYL